MKPREEAVKAAAQCWCDEETQTIEMDTRLAMAFAKRYDQLLAENEVLKAERIADLNLLGSQIEQIAELKKQAESMINFIEHAENFSQCLATRIMANKAKKKYQQFLKEQG